MIFTFTYLAQFWSNKRLWILKHHPFIAPPTQLVIIDHCSLLAKKTSRNRFRPKNYSKFKSLIKSQNILLFFFSKVDLYILLTAKKKKEQMHSTKHTVPSYKKTYYKQHKTFYINYVSGYTNTKESIIDLSLTSFLTNEKGLVTHCFHHNNINHHGLQTKSGHVRLKVETMNKKVNL